MYLGIDFGTSYSTLSVYYMDCNGSVNLISNLCGDQGFHTWMRWDSSANMWYYGDDCRADVFSKDTIKNIKAQIRSGGDIDKKVSSDGYTISYRELLKNYLSWLIRSCYDNLITDNIIDSDEQIEGVVVTVPCGFTERGMTRSKYGQVIREGVIEAYQEVINSGVVMACVGNPPVRIIEEPVAAAMEYLKSSRGRRVIAQNPNMKILVADLGGGTFDVTVIQCDGDEKFKVITKDGDLHLGGNDYDEIMLEVCLNKIKSEYPDFDCSTWNRDVELYRATAAKEGLTRNLSYSFISSNNKKVIITRDEFEEATKKLLSRMQEKIKNCVDASGGIETIDKIILVGGACRMPQVKKGIMELYSEFDENGIILNKPSYSIANGAAYLASMGDSVGVTVLEDCATCTYGFLYSDSVSYVDYIRNMIFCGDLFKGGEIQCGETSPFIPKEDYQKSVIFRCYESTYKKGEKDIKFKGNEKKFNTNGLEVSVSVPEEYCKYGRARQYELTPKMTLTSDGILKLEIYHGNVLVGSNEIKTQ